MIIGTLSLISTPDQRQLALDTDEVINNNGFDERDKVRYADYNHLGVIPRNVGDPSPIKHVIYIIKENRTYDQVLGDLGKGNGDPSIELFNASCTPNQHALADQFVTLDNFFVDAEVSASGWNWSTGAEANTYVEKNWPAEYSGRRPLYDFEGGNKATAANSDVNDAYIWTHLNDAHISFRNYGFFVGTSTTGTWNSITGYVPGVITNVVAPTEPVLVSNSDLNYPGYSLTIQDQTRVAEWLKEFNNYVSNSNLPTVELVRLPNDHTSVTSVGKPSPAAYVADNDLALGKIVDAVSHSPYWKNTAIFVVEDDSQEGPDHVDAHRTIAQVISPYTQYGSVDSTFYTTTSMLRTIELITGIGPMTQFDAAATPMVNCFQHKPNLTPYTAIVPSQSILNQYNPANAPMALASEKMNLSVADALPDQVANLAIWESVKGAGSVMPTPKTIFRSYDPDMNNASNTTKSNATDDND
jgi:hypothetical protein